MRRLRKFLTLEPAERRLFVTSIGLLFGASLVLRWRGFAAARAFVSAFSVGAERLNPIDAARMVDAAASLTGASCLPRSLVLWRLLREHGAAICFGVARTLPNGIVAHAWVELDGIPLNDGADVTGRYSVLAGGARRGATA